MNCKIIKNMNHLGLFEGIGGFSLAARWMNWNTVAWVEKDEFCQKVLNKNFPYAKGHGDIKEFDGTGYRGNVDIVTGGFPCQPFSVAGKRKGTDDERHLWPEMLRVIREVQPAWVVGENVAGIINMENGEVFQNILDGLESEGYAVQSFVIPACAVEAPHRRSRVWIIAHLQGQSGTTELQPKSSQPEQREPGRSVSKRVATGTSDERRNSGWNNREKRHVQSFEIRGASKNQPERNRRECRTGKNNKTFTDTNSIGPQGQREYRGQLHPKSNKKGKINRTIYAHQFEKPWLEVAARLCRMDDGVSGRLDKNRKPRLKALGNAVVPQVPFEIFKAIEDFMNKN